MPSPGFPNHGSQFAMTIHDNHGSQKATDTEATVAADDAAARWSGLSRSAEPWDAPCHFASLLTAAGIERPKKRPDWPFGCWVQPENYQMENRMRPGSGANELVTL